MHDGVRRTRLARRFAAAGWTRKKAAPVRSGVNCVARRRGGIAASGLQGLDIGDGDLAGAAIGFGIERDFLALGEAAQAGALQGGGVDEHVLAAIVRLDEAETL